MLNLCFQHHVQNVTFCPFFPCESPSRKEVLDRRGRQRCAMSSSLCRAHHYHTFLARTNQLCNLYNTTVMTGLLIRRVCWPGPALCTDRDFQLTRANCNHC
ncbi:hypothetical protein VTK73DRAFT_9648 [Phialemonium thermophilum]|uniref:Uncharacterized protein n=1 Tax=Phialemonium thermophilum TaxID=223376 RepID=A0ABR3W174_9PEZI